MDNNSNSIRQCPRQVCDDFNKFIDAPENSWSCRISRSGPSGFWPHYMKWPRLVEAAEAGCNTCSIFRDAAAGFNPDLGCLEYAKARAPGFNELTSEPTSNDEEKGIKAVSLSLEDLPGVGVLRFYSPRKADEGCCSWPLESLPPKLKEYTLDARIATVETWLRDCRDNHPNCCKRALKLPKRVLDVSPREGGLRLYETDGNESAEYICLSHRWGSTRPLTTTKATLEKLESSIPWEIVPRTFQDAITVTRRLGVRYLWIDSLCIVQDDIQEWEDQAPEMCAIYGNAFLTLAAARCNDSTDTLLPDFRRTVAGRDHHGNPTTVAVRSSGPHLDNLNSGGYPLLQRGWVLQERLLSRRLLHFAFDELIWECERDVWCECGGSQDGLEKDLRALYRKGPRFWEQGPHFIWHKVVEEYTRLELTYSSDRAVAVLGIARDMELTRKRRYVCGLWEDTLVSDLAWRAGDPNQAGDPNPSKLPGPTWSWISISGRCTWWDCYQVEWVDRSIARVHPGTQSPQQLTVQGRCIVGVSAAYGDFDVQNLEFLGTESNAIAWEWFTASFGYEDWTTDFSPDYRHETPVPEEETVFWLHIGSIQHNSRERAAGYQDTEIGLVLKCVDATLQLYERVGVTRHLGLLGTSQSSRTREAFLNFGEDMVFNIV